eukprot:Amastigsp_a843042_51.p5 type:complete len:144 gc:universal Amastigsp_a843042_51:885-454(-)
MPNELAVHLLERVGVVLGIEEAHKAIAFVLAHLVAHDLGFGERAIVAERVRQDLSRDVLPEIADKKPKVVLGPLLQRRIGPRFACGVHDHLGADDRGRLAFLGRGLGRHGRRASLCAVLEFDAFGHPLRPITFFFVGSRALGG